MANVTLWGGSYPDVPALKVPQTGGGEALFADTSGVTAGASDVVAGKNIVDASGNTVPGSLVIQHYYTGSGAPSASLGVNGDIYFQT